MEAVQRGACKVEEGTSHMGMEPGWQQARPMAETTMQPNTAMVAAQGGPPSQCVAALQEGSDWPAPASTSPFLMDDITIEVMGSIPRDHQPPQMVQTPNPPFHLTFAAAHTWWHCTHLNIKEHVMWCNMRCRVLCRRVGSHCYMQPQLTHGALFLLFLFF